jgi:aminoglycoside 3-N-acetyltransferase I
MVLLGGLTPHDRRLAMRIERITEAAAVHAAVDLFDGPPLATATDTFLASPTHHLLFAYDDDGRPIGMISGVETTHPDKGTEMFLYELEVVPVARLQGVATALVKALAAIGRERGCYGMWVGTESDNAAALATYRGAGADDEAPFVLLSWDLTRTG